MLLLSCLSLSLVARALGTTQPPNPALRGFVEGCEGKPQPCWYGIVPGVTTAEQLVQIEAKKLISIKSQLENKCEIFVRNENDVVYGIFIRNCKGVRIGDLAQIFGLPQFFIPVCNAGTDYTFYESVVGTTNINWPSLFGEVRWLTVNGIASRRMQANQHHYIFQGFRSQQHYKKIYSGINCANRG